MSKHVERVPYSKPTQTEKAISQKTYGANPVTQINIEPQQSTHRNTEEGQSQNIRITDPVVEPKVGPKRPRSAIREKKTDIQRGAEVSDEPAPAGPAKKSKSQSHENNLNTGTENAGISEGNDPLATDLYLNDLAEAFNDQVETKASGETVTVDESEEDPKGGCNPVPAAKKQMCRQCGMQVTSKNLQRHRRLRHSQPDSAPCQVAKANNQRNLSSL